MPLCPSQASGLCTAGRPRPPAWSPPGPFHSPHCSGSERAVLPNLTEALDLEFTSLLCLTKSSSRFESVLEACGRPAGWRVFGGAPSTACPSLITAAWAASALLTCVLACGVGGWARGRVLGFRPWGLSVAGPPSVHACPSRGEWGGRALFRSTGGGAAGRDTCPMTSSPQGAASRSESSGVPGGGAGLLLGAGLLDATAAGPWEDIYLSQNLRNGILFPLFHL